MELNNNNFEKKSTKDGRGLEEFNRLPWRKEESFFSLLVLLRNGTEEASAIITRE